MLICVIFASAFLLFSLLLFRAAACSWYFYCTRAEDVAGSLKGQSHEMNQAVDVWWESLGLARCRGWNLNFFLRLLRFYSKIRKFPAANAKHRRITFLYPPLFVNWLAVLCLPHRILYSVWSPRSRRLNKASKSYFHINKSLLHPWNCPFKGTLAPNYNLFMNVKFLHYQSFGSRIA